MFEMLKGWVSSAKAKIRAKLKKLPPLEVLVREHKAYLAALAKIGDRISAFEPEQVAQLDYVRLAIRGAQFAAGKNVPGLQKFAEVEIAVRAAWIAANYADDKFDKWWADIRPFIDTYVGEVKAADAWVAPPQ